VRKLADPGVLGKKKNATAATMMVIVPSMKKIQGYRESVSYGCP